MDATVQVNALIVPDNHLTYDVIVGRDFLKRDDIIIIKRGKDLIFKQLSAINDRSGNIIDINFSAINAPDDIAKYAVGITKEARQPCTELLQQFRDCISFSIADLGKTNAAALDIRCTSDVPVVYRPYRLASKKRIVREMIQELLTNNIIRESSSSYASPILIVKKKNGEYRMCIDYRKLNAITIKDKYPMPLIEEQIDKLGGSRYFTCLDLASGYQVPVAAGSVEKTAFVTPEGHYEFLHMPFGLTNAPAVFQRLMNTVLDDLKNSVAIPYLDDVIIPANTIEEGMSRLRQMLETFRAQHLTLKLEKCSFFS